jgi:hypothetical protein
LSDSDPVQIFDSWVVVEQLHVGDLEPLLNLGDRVAGLDSIDLGTELKFWFLGRYPKLHPYAHAVSVLESIAAYDVFDRASVGFGYTS